MSNYLRDRWPLSPTSSVYMNGTAVYTLVRPDKAGIFGSVVLTPEQYTDYVEGVHKEVRRAQNEAWWEGHDKHCNQECYCESPYEDA